MVNPKISFHKKNIYWNWRELKEGKGITLELNLITGSKMSVCLNNHDREFIPRQALQEDLPCSKFIWNFRFWNESIRHHGSPPLLPLHKHLCCLFHFHWSSNQKPHQCRLTIPLQNVHHTRNQRHSKWEKSLEFQLKRKVKKDKNYRFRRRHAIITFVKNIFWCTQEFF